MAKTFGTTVKELYWTQGKYDIVTIVDAPDESSAMALSLSPKANAVLSTVKRGED